MSSTSFLNFLPQFAQIHQNLLLQQQQQPCSSSSSRTTVDSHVRQVKGFLAQRIYNSTGKPTFSVAKKFKNTSISINDLLSTGKEINYASNGQSIQCIEGFLLALYHAHRLGIMYTPCVRPSLMQLQWNPLAVGRDQPQQVISILGESSSCYCSSNEQQQQKFNPMTVSELSQLTSSASQDQQPCVTALFPLRFVAKDSSRIHSHIVLGVMVLFPTSTAAPSTTLLYRGEQQQQQQQQRGCNGGGVENNISKNNYCDNHHGDSPSDKKRKCSVGNASVRAQSAALKRSMLGTGEQEHDEVQNQSSPLSSPSSSSSALPPRLVGTIGISRVPDLGTSSNCRCSFVEICHDFIDAYARCGNEVLEIILGGPIALPHLSDKQSGQTKRVTWKLATAVRGSFVADTFTSSPASASTSPSKGPKKSPRSNRAPPSNSQAANSAGNGKKTVVLLPPTAAKHETNGDEDIDDGDGDGDDVVQVIPPFSGTVIMTDSAQFECSLAMMEDVLVRAAFRNQQTLVSTLSPAQLRITGFGSPSVKSPNSKSASSALTMNDSSSSCCCCSSVTNEVRDQKANPDCAISTDTSSPKSPSVAKSRVMQLTSSIEKGAISKQEELTTKDQRFSPSRSPSSSKVATREKTKAKKIQVHEKQSRTSTATIEMQRDSAAVASPNKASTTRNERTSAATLTPSSLSSPPTAKTATDTKTKKELNRLRRRSASASSTTAKTESSPRKQNQVSPSKLKNKQSSSDATQQQQEPEFTCSIFDLMNGGDARTTANAMSSYYPSRLPSNPSTVLSFEYADL